jgi:superfamily II DNA or RNA helicase
VTESGPRISLRSWQAEALVAWRRAGNRGIVSVVTGGGKTVFALACIEDVRSTTALIVVPTVALLEQWWEEAANFFGLELDEVHLVSLKGGMRSGTINIAVLNTAARLATEGRIRPCFLIVDECHKAASDSFRSVLQAPKVASLGLSATPERPYDDGLGETLVPALGPVIYQYSHRDALRDGVIVPFELVNVVFELEAETQDAYDKLTKAIGRSVKTYGSDAQETIKLLLRRARIMNLSLNRVRLACRLVASATGRRTLVFHEDIKACDLIHQILQSNGVSSGVYHSTLPVKKRAEMLSKFRRGDLKVLTTCRALDEGLNVPDVEVGIVAASTATRRQRIQRMGRILRPSPEKLGAVVYTLAATGPEVTRLREEAVGMEGVAKVTWVQA